MKWTLLYFDDQLANIECFRELLSENFYVIGCQDATKYEEALQENYPHVILLDVHMPVIDGHALFNKISDHPLYNGCPVIFISGDQSDETKIKSYAGGGIDFLPRDLRAEETLLRLTNKIKFFLQRSTMLELGNLKVDLSSMKAEVAGKSVDMTILEMRMISHILRAYPNPISRQELIMKVWGNDSVKPGTINTHLTNLKPKIEKWDYVIKMRDENLRFVKKEEF